VELIVEVPGESSPQAAASTPLHSGKVIGINLDGSLKLLTRSGEWVNAQVGELHLLPTSAQDWFGGTKMFEDFRKQIDDSSFSDDDQTTQALEKDKDKGYFLGMSPVQRFILVFMLLIITTMLGVLFLLVTSKVVPPSMY
jgi:hypothetical protein